MREQQARTNFLLDNPDVVLFDAAKKLCATGRTRIRSPARLPTELTMAIRDAAAKAFKASCFPEPRAAMAVALWSTLTYEVFHSS